MTIVFGAGKEAETYIREFSGTDEIENGGKLSREYQLLH